MLKKISIDEEVKEINIKKIPMKDLQRELVPEIKSRLELLKKEKEKATDEEEDEEKIGSAKEFFATIDTSKIGDFIMSNIEYVQAKIEKYTNLNKAEIEDLSLAESIDLVKAISALSFGAEVGKLLNVFNAFSQSLLIPTMKQMI